MNEINTDPWTDNNHSYNSNGNVKTETQLKCTHKTNAIYEFLLKYHLHWLPISIQISKCSFDLCIEEKKDVKMSYEIDFEHTVAHSSGAIRKKIGNKIDEMNMANGPFAKITWSKHQTHSNMNEKLNCN